MNLLHDDIKILYAKYLIASVGSALAMSIYAFVDTVAVGQSEGSEGAAAMAVILPVYGVLVFIGVICGVGGSVLLGNSWGRGDIRKGNVYFTASFILESVLVIIMWAFFVIYHEEILFFFGADTVILPKVMEYSKWVVWMFPFFAAPTFISAFIRNDNAPGLAMKAIIIGGVINMFGDWYLVFPLKMGMEGAAIATVIGTVTQTLIMCMHFMNPVCRLRLVKPERIFVVLTGIVSAGLGTGIIELGTMSLTIIMNNRIMTYGGSTALSIYGVTAALSSLFMAIYAGAGQALQPIASANFGAGRTERVRKVFIMSILAGAVMCIIFAGVCEIFPVEIMKIMMSVTPEVLNEAPHIVRIYSIVLIPMSFNIIAIYFLQSIMKSKPAMIFALMRGIVLSGALLVILPLMFGLDGVISALPASEFLTLIIAAVYVKGSF